MMKQLFASALLLSLVGCMATAEDTPELEYDEGFWVEVIDSIPNPRDNPYNHDNTIYVPGKEYIFDYQFFNKAGEERKITRQGYSLRPLDSLTTATIMKFSVEADTDRFLGADDPEYRQTELKYRYYLINDSINPPVETSGVIENKKNVWMHPWRRARLFYYLQLNPYPFIQAPYEIGNSWGWSFVVGSQWGDQEWASWEGGIELKHQYEIVARETINTAFTGDLECFVVEGVGTSELGQTTLTSYFNETFGFIRFDYLNIDSSRFIINLIEVKEKS